MPSSIRPPLMTSMVLIIFAVSAGFRNAVQMTMWPIRTRSVGAASAASDVNDSKVISSVGRGTVWKWSNIQIDSKPRRFRLLRDRFGAQPRARGSHPSYSPVQPWGTITPTFITTFWQRRGHPWSAPTLTAGI